MFSQEIILFHKYYRLELQSAEILLSEEIRQLKSVLYIFRVKEEALCTITGMACYRKQNAG